MSRGRGPTPPHDTDAEEALLGAMLLSPDAVERVVPLMGPEDFYSPRNREIFHALAGMFGDGEVIDTVTLSGALKERGSLEEIGGSAEVVRLLSVGGTPSNVKAYAAQVVSAAQHRRLIAACQDVISIAFEQGQDPGELVEELNVRGAELMGSSLVEVPGDLWTIDEFLDRPEVERPKWVIPGLLRVGWRAMVVAAEGVGKLLPLSTPIPTPEGWTTMGAVEVGDEIFDHHGSPCRVVGTSEVDPAPESYVVRFSDGSEQVACVDHQWITVDYRARQPGPNHGKHEVRTTGEIRDTLHARGGHCANHAVPVAGALECPEVELPIDPYLLGVWLGDGSTGDGKVWLGDRDAVAILERIEWPHHVIESSVDAPGASLGYRLEGFKVKLREEGLLGSKHIPRTYLRASIPQRLALLQGLMDTDGYVPESSGRGRGSGAVTCELVFTCEQLARDAHELVLTLGVKASIAEGEAKLDGRVIGPKWRITFQTDLPVATVPFKAERLGPLRTDRARYRYITAVEPVEPEPMRCIMVDSPDSTYLCGPNLIPTHNTVLMRQIGLAAAQGIHPFTHSFIEPCRTLIVDLENPDDSILDVCNPIRAQVLSTSDEYDPNRAWLWHRPGGVNLRKRYDRSEFEAVLSHVKPDLVCLGPLYKAYRVEAREADEQAAGEVMSVFDDLRTRYGFALMMEHHAPKGAGGGTRELMPYGSSLWLRWPEIGLKMTPADDTNAVMELGRWRGDRLENEWPEEIFRSKPWPWASAPGARTVRMEQDSDEPF